MPESSPAPEQVRLTDDDMSALIEWLPGTHSEAEAEAENLRPTIERIVAEHVARAFEPIEALALRWQRESAERGAEDRIYTSGAAELVLHEVRRARGGDDRG